MPLSVWTMAPENDFLQVLARAVRDGFPLQASAQRPPLMQWTILVPTRRAARGLQDAFERLADGRAVILPRIKPIGDIDEDFLDDSLPEEGVPDAISKHGEVSLLLNLVNQWAAANPHYAIAQDVIASGAQAFHLTLSLLDLQHQSETEEKGFAALPDVYGLDLAGHRTAILSLLDVLAQDMPQELAAQNLLGPNARRNIMIRLEAKRIRDGKQRGPIIAAGSTGTNPATRDLLLAIAGHPQGAVVLPGLDTELDDNSWAAITPEHPQFALKTLLAQWQVKRQEVGTLGAPPANRARLASLALRPAATTDSWADAIAACITPPSALMEGVTLIEAADRQEEARVIALAFRRHLAEGSGTAALITPDRDLARRVMAEAARWNMAVDDSSGEALSRQRTGALAILLLRLLIQPDDTDALLALLSHPDCTLGWPRADIAEAVQHLEITCIRGMTAGTDFTNLVAMIDAARHQASVDPHVHPVIRHLTAEHWDNLKRLAVQVESLLKPFDHAADTLRGHVDRLSGAIKDLAPEVPPDAPEQARLLEVFESLRQASDAHPRETLARAAHTIIHAISTDVLRRPQIKGVRLAIYGLLEARLVSPDLAILGGLTEKSWPAVPDAGPWLNRPMRETFGLQQPERDIGTTAHDFCQALGHRRVIITWPRKLGGSPAIPSRWIVRLRMVLAALGLPMEQQLDESLPALACALDRPADFKPVSKPRPSPPVDWRPRSFSVTGVEKLVRDSYAIYAKRILELEPLPDLNTELDASLRGSLIHEALNVWARAGRVQTPEQNFQLLLSQGEQVFAPYMHMPEVSKFWWPRFRRMAEEFVQLDATLRAETEATLTEVNAKHEFPIAGVMHKLTARADRIDVQQGRRVTIYDYKSGAVPSGKQVKSGFAPQLPLEAALVQHGAFGGNVPLKVVDAAYVQVGGSAQGVAVKWATSEGGTIEELAAHQFAKLQELLAAYLDPGTAYLPRHNLQNEEEASDYDHLSRYQEWRQVEKNTP